MSEQKDDKWPIDRLLSEIAVASNSAHPNRGKLADLRQALNDNLQMRAWPYLTQYCDITKARELLIYRICAGAAATLMTDNLVRSNIGNIGASLRQYATDNGKDLDGLDRFSSRFRRMLTCRSVEEMFPQMVSVIHAFSSKGVALDVRKLFWDIYHWENNDEVRLEWAKGYWDSFVGAKEEEPDDGTTLSE